MFLRGNPFDPPLAGTSPKIRITEKGRESSIEEFAEKKLQRHQVNNAVVVSGLSSTMLIHEPLDPITVKKHGTTSALIAEEKIIH